VEGVASTSCELAGEKRTISGSANCVEKPSNYVQAEKPSNYVQAEKPSNYVQAEKPSNYV